MRARMVGLGLLIYWITVIIYFSDRFMIGASQTVPSCLHADMFLVDRSDNDVEQGELVAFKFGHNRYQYKEGDRFIKLVAGVPGDTISVTEHSLLVNGVPFKRANSMTYLLEILGDVASKYETEFELGRDEFFLVGETKESFDSRFWGVVNKSQFIGQVYAIY